MSSSGSRLNRNNKLTKKTDRAGRRRQAVVDGILIMKIRLITMKHFATASFPKGKMGSDKALYSYSYSSQTTLQFLASFSKQSIPPKKKPN